METARVRRAQLTARYIVIAAIDSAAALMQLRAHMKRRP